MEITHRLDIVGPMPTDISRPTWRTPTSQRWVPSYVAIHPDCSFELLMWSMVGFRRIVYSGGSRNWMSDNWIACTRRPPTFHITRASTRIGAEWRTQRRSRGHVAPSRSPSDYFLASMGKLRRKYSFQHKQKYWNAGISWSTAASDTSTRMLGA